MRQETWKYNNEHMAKTTLASSNDTIYHDRSRWAQSVLLSQVLRIKPEALRKASLSHCVSSHTTAVPTMLQGDALLFHCPSLQICGPNSEMQVDCLDANEHCSFPSHPGIQMAAGDKESAFFQASGDDPRGSGRRLSVGGKHSEGRCHPSVNLAHWSLGCDWIDLFPSPYLFPSA